MIRHRAGSLRDHAYALIKAELDSDFEDKCREISKNRNTIIADKDDDNDDDDDNNKEDKCENVDDKDENNKNSPSASGSVVLNGKKLPSSRKRKVPAWARGYVKKVTKKKKILFDDSINEVEKSLTSSSNSSAIAGVTCSVDLDKFQELESSSNCIQNGEVTTIVENTESDNDESTNDNNIKENTGTIKIEIIDDAKQEEVVELIKDDKSGNSGESIKGDNENSNTSSRRESTDELTFADELNIVRNGDCIIVDKNELENMWKHAVDVTSNLSVDVLCDIYVQLSRCVAKYEQIWDRTTLPKVNFKRKNIIIFCRLVD